MLRLWMSCLLLLVVSFTCVTGSAAAVIGSWNFNENNCSAAPFTALDSSTHNLNGIITGAFGCVPGVTGNALSFAGAGEYIEVPASSIYSPSNSLILEASINLPGGGNPFIFNRTDAQGNGFTLQAVAPFTLSLSFDQVGQPTNNLTIGTIDPFNSTSWLFPFGQWVNIKVHVNTQLGEVRFYINGVLNSVQNCPIAVPLLKVDAPLKIGGIGGQYGFIGSIDDVRVSTDDPLLAVAIAGAGTVNSDQPGLACASALCGFYTSSGTPITLMATPGAHSVFNGWSGCTSDPGNPNNCSLTFNADQNVTANFLTTYMVKIPGAPDNYFDTLSKAYQSSRASKTFVARAGILAEDFFLDRPITVTLDGGYDPAFGTIVGKSIIQGALVIQQGKLIAKNLQIRPATSVYSFTSPADGAVDVTISSSVQCSASVGIGLSGRLI